MTESVAICHQCELETKSSFLPVLVTICAYCCICGYNMRVMLYLQNDSRVYSQNF